MGIAGGGLARVLQPSAREIELLGQFCGIPFCIYVLHAMSSSDDSCEGLLGELMIRSLKMLVLPLVAGCMVASVCALGEAGSGMGRTAAWTLGIFFATTSISALLGVTLAAAFHPGHDGDLSSQGMSTGTVNQSDTVPVLLTASSTARSTSCNNALRTFTTENRCTHTHSAETLVLSCAGMQLQHSKQALPILLGASKLTPSLHMSHTTSGDDHDRQVLFCMSA